MADFWIKIEKSTPDKPEIFEISEALDLDPDTVLGKLIRVWVWMDSNSESGHIKSVTAKLIDRVSGHKGFANAMKKYGWLEDDHIPNFDRHMGESAKKRAKDSERKRKSRVVTGLSAEAPQNVRNVSENIVTKSGLDKSREDKSKDTPVAKAPTAFHVEVIDLYHSILPELKGVVVSRWSGSSREKDLRVRVKEHTDHTNIDFWKWLFEDVKCNDWQMGRKDTWSADLGFLLKRANFDKAVERAAANQKARG